MNRILRICPVLLIAIVLIAAIFLCTGNAFAETSGNCGDGLTWTLTDDGTLKIEGSGDVWNATPRSLSPLERNTGFWTQA